MKRIKTFFPIIVFLLVVFSLGARTYSEKEKQIMQLLKSKTMNSDAVQVSEIINPMIDSLLHSNDASIWVGFFPPSNELFSFNYVYQSKKIPIDDPILQSQFTIGEILDALEMMGRDEYEYGNFSERMSFRSFLLEFLGSHLSLFAENEEYNEEYQFHTENMARIVEYVMLVRKVLTDLESYGLVTCYATKPKINTIFLRLPMHEMPQAKYSQEDDAASKGSMYLDMRAMYGDEFSDLFITMQSMTVLVHQLEYQEFIERGYLTADEDYERTMLKSTMDSAQAANSSAIIAAIGVVVGAIFSSYALLKSNTSNKKKRKRRNYHPMQNNSSGKNKKKRSKNIIKRTDT